MTNSSILLFASDTEASPGHGAAGFAVGAAAALGAHLDILVPFLDVLSPNSWEGRSDEQIKADSAAQRQKAVDRADAIAASADKAKVTASTTVDWAHAFGLIPYVGDQTKLHDLLVTGVDHSVYLSERKIAEHALFDSGRPVVIVPALYAGGFACSKVVVAWDHSRTAARALHDALPFLRLAREIRLVAVGGEKRFQVNPNPATVEAAMAKKGLAAQFEQIELGKRTIGEALQNHALDQGTDLLVMGGYGHSRLRDFILGGATREIFDDPKLPILLSH